MTTVGILSRGGGGKKPTVHLIDSAGARTRCGSFSAWGTSFYGGSGTGIQFVDIERFDANGLICGRCLMGLDVDYKSSWDDETPQYNRRGHIVEDIDELVSELRTK